MRPGSVLRLSRSEVVREEGRQNPRQRQRHKHSDERNSLMHASLAVRGTLGQDGERRAGSLVCPLGSWSQIG